MDSYQLARRKQEIAQDWSDFRRAIDTWILKRANTALAEYRFECDVRKDDREGQKFSLSANPDLDCVPCHETERQAIHLLHLKQGAVQLARLAEREANEAWRRDTRQIVGPAKSYLPPMDSEGQLKASQALGCARNHKPETIQALAQCDFNEGERIGKGFDLAVVQTNKTLALKVSTYNRRSTRGKGRKCRK